MEKKNFNKNKLINYWTESADDDYETMLVMYKNEKYNWSLFVGHLIIEKLLKAYHVKVKNDYPPFVHNLLRLAEQSGLKLTEEQETEFANITAFNINARYDDFKMSFKEKCTKEFTDEWIKKIKLLRKWIKEQIKK